MSGKFIGQCLRVKYRSGVQLYNTVVICWAGSIDTILAIPGMANTNPIKIGSCVTYATTALVLGF